MPEARESCVRLTPARFRNFDRSVMGAPLHRVLCCTKYIGKIYSNANRIEGLGPVLPKGPGPVGCQVDRAEWVVTPPDPQGGVTRV